MSANPTFGILWLSIATTIYAVVNYVTGKNGVGSPRKATSIYFLIYALVVIVGELVINLNLTTDLCGSAQWGSTLLVTFVPWTLIFGTLVFILQMFPGWLSPFANTFGYIAAKLAGLNGVLEDILIADPKGAPGKDKAMDEALAHIYTDKSLLVNAVTISNFNFFWDNMKGVFKPSVYEDPAKRMSLWNMIWLKDVVAEYIWYMLAGVTVVSVGYNYLLSAGCSTSAADMEKRHAEYQQKMADQKAEDEKSQEKRVYSSLE